MCDSTGNIFVKSNVSMDSEQRCNDDFMLSLLEIIP